MGQLGTAGEVAPIKDYALTLEGLWYEFWGSLEAVMSINLLVFDIIVYKDLNKIYYTSNETVELH